MARHGVKLDTLKDCLQFLEWLHRHKNMEGLVAIQLTNQLSNKYKSVSKDAIKQALSDFLGHVLNFHKKLCKNPQRGKHDRINSTDALCLLLQCIPQFLAALYYLRYNVDENFKEMGGGEWADKYPGGGSWGGELDKYLYARPGSNTHGIIAGGFTSGDLKYGDRRNGYYQGKDMSGDLTIILNKHSSEHNVFLDVFSTSVFGNNGTGISNTANALALARSFCEIVGNEQYNNNGGELVKTLNNGLNGRNRICWDNLKDHCAKLRDQFRKIFTNNRFSFTGYGRETQYLNKETFAMEVAKWLRTSLPEVKDHLAEIKHLDKKYAIYDSRRFMTSKVLIPKYAKALSDYFAKNLFSYGFTFYGYNFGTESTKYEVLSGDWHDVINVFRNAGDGLDRLKTILEGELCPRKDNEEDDKNEPEKDTSQKHEAPHKVPEAPNKAVLEEKVAVPKKAEYPPPEVTDSAANQGKKSEGAQNQGKKVDSPQSQNNGQSEGTSPSLPDAQAVQIQPQTVSTSDSQSSRASGPDGGRVASSDAAQTSAQGGQKTQGADATVSSATSSGTGVGGDGEGSDSVGKGNGDPPPNTPPHQCKDANFEHYTMGDSKYCVRKHTLKLNPEDQEQRDDVWEAQKRHIVEQIYDKHNNDHPNRQILRNRINTTQSRILHTLPSQPSRPAPGPSPHPNLGRTGSGPDYYEPRGVRNSPIDQVIYNVNGIEVKDPFYEELEKVQRRNNAEEKRKALQWQVNQDEIFREVQRREEESIRKMQQHNDMLILRDLNDDVGEVVDPPRDIKFDIYAPHLMQYVENDPPKIQLFVDTAPTNDLGDYHMRPQSVIVDDLDIYVLHPSAGPTENSEPIPGAQIGIDPVYDPPDVLISRPLKDENADIFIQDAYGAEISRSFAIETLKPRLPNISFSMFTQDSSSPFVPKLPVEITRPPEQNLDDPSNSNFQPTDITFDFQLDDPLFSKRLKPILPGVVIEQADLKASECVDDDPELCAMSDGKTHIDLQIDVPRRTLPDASYDLNIDDPPPPQNVQPLEPMNPATSAININVAPPEPLPDLPDNFAADYIHTPSAVGMCIAPWMNQTKTGDSTDIPETELFPAEAPRTVRDMLQWLAGLKNPKHHETLKLCIAKAFNGLHSDPKQLALSINHTNILPDNVFDILQLTAMYASSVLTAIAPHWKTHVSSRAVQPMSSNERDCCALLCQLRDYVYACHHQLQFLKAQCNRDESHGGWQDCGYGSDITPPNSALQAFLTDGWDSAFDTHPFDPCNLCLKSRIRMGFRDKDLPSSQQTGATLSTILTPSCGGSDPLLTLASYLNKSHGHCLPLVL